MSVRLDPPAEVRWITRVLEEAGHETWTVGGAVRNPFVGHPSGDWDLATHARPGDVRRLFRRTVPIGIEHGTVGVLSRQGTLYEVTTFRRDVETDGRHAVVAFAETLEEDLARRDFTINAIAFHALREELRDPFDGVGDLRRGVLRTVGRPEERFAEDFLRVLRGLRFAGHFDLDIEPATWQALCVATPGLSALSAERVREELWKVLDKSGDPRRSLRLYAESGALQTLFGELASLPEQEAAARRGVSGWELAVETAAALPPGRAALRLAGLLRGVPARDAAALLSRLRLSNAVTDEIARIAGADALPDADCPDADFRRWLSRHGRERLAAAARVQLARAGAAAGLGLPDRREDVVRAWSRARAVRAQAPPLEVADLAIDGRDLVRMGLRPGPRFGVILEELLDWVLEDPARNESGALEGRVAALVATGEVEAGGEGDRSGGGEAAP